MPNLGDYLGKILSEVTVARLNADIETLRVAEIYASHPLLKRMPVPRFRLPTVEVDVPVAIEAAGDAQTDQDAAGSPTLADMRTAFGKLLTGRLTDRGIRLQPARAKKLDALIDRATQELGQPVGAPGDVGRVADELSAQATAFLVSTGGALPSAEEREFQDTLRVAAKKEFAKLRKPPPRIQILAVTSELRQAGPSDTMTRIKMRITEEGVEWTSIEQDGKSQERLVAE